MFGGFGLYCDGLFFALVAEETLYLKVDDDNRPAYLAQGLTPFTYSMKDGRLATMNYYPLPAEVLEDQASLLQWARAALAVALRAKKANKPPRRKGYVDVSS